MHGPTCIFWANLTPFSLEATMPEDKEKIFAAVEELPGGFLRCPRPPGAVKRH